MAWAIANRGPLVSAALTLGRAWVGAGKPRWSGAGLGSFERWSEIMGGVLEVAGVVGFLADRPALQPGARTDGLVALLDRWWERHGDQAFGVRELLPLAHENGGLNLEIGKGGGASSRLGQLLRSAKGGAIGRWTLQPEGKYQGAQRYRIRASV